jgi:hypothetical protein
MPSCRSARGILSKLEGSNLTPAVPEWNVVRVLVPPPARHLNFHLLLLTEFLDQGLIFARCGFRGFLVLIRRNSQPLPYYF